MSLVCTASEVEEEEEESTMRPGLCEAVREETVAQRARGMVTIKPLR